MTQVNAQVQNAPDNSKNNSTSIEIAQPQTASERFTSMVLREFSGVNQGLELTSFQKRLCQSYFVKLDEVLQLAERKRMMKSEQTRDVIPVTWDNVNLRDLSQKVVAFSSVGLDPMQPNHLNLIPYKNNTTCKYDIGFIIGYRGCEVKATKYGLDVPDEVIVEVVYKNDKFKQIKKDINNKFDSYTFEIVDDFNRGEIVGGFYYLAYHNNPGKNKVEAWNMDDVYKRKPEYASVEFWGGEKNKDEWFTNAQGNREKRVVKIKVDGWLDEMVYKTLFRAAYNSITIDSQKIDEAYHSILKIESDLKSDNVRKEIIENANKTEIGFEEAELVNEKALTQGPENITIQQKESEQVNPQVQPEQSNGTLFTETQGPTY